MSINPSLQSKNNPDEIELGKIFGILIDNRWSIIAITLIFCVAGILYAMLSTPIYKADALIQVETKSSGLPSLGEMGELFSTESSSTTEVEIIKSRMILGETVDKLNLTTVVSPKFMPIIGKGISRLKGDSSYIEVSYFEMENSKENLLIRIDENNINKFQLLSEDGTKILEGEVGKLAKSNDENFNILITKIDASEGDLFKISKRSKLDAIQYLQSNLLITERGKQTGILQLTFTGENKSEIENILNDISNNYFIQNVERNSEEAENSLQFLSNHLPDIKAQLTNAEDVLNQFRQDNESIDLGLEAKSTLDVMVKLESQLNELTFKESEISQRFTKEHPAYVSLLDKRKTLLHERERLNRQIQRLPKTQREILRMTRDVEVNQQIYLQLLSKVQELNIVKASTVGNVRILDSAQAHSAPVEPRKPLIVVLALIIGAITSIGVAFLRAAFNRGVENPDEIEAIGLPVYASIPMSDWQVELEKKQKGKKALNVNDTLLAISNPADLSIEALRSLRTSLHFAMMEAKNNVLMISGPSPGIGKSFVSANMAAVIAKSGQKVLVIDADMRKGRMEKQMAVEAKPGLSSYLSGQLSIEQLIKKPGVEGMDFIGRGDVPPNPSELLMHPRFKQLMDWASENYDLVIVDTPPILAVTDPAIVGAHAGTTLIVGRFGQNAVKEIDIAKQRFEQNGIEVKGFILNAVVRKASSYYGGNYGYYNYSYSESK
ncbi:tyrosine-protein kinase [Photobacterium gaetbulicola]|uniref:Putative tyrosine-protein kinase Wzc n=1 Tax=Photobacterium gaetbulicola Gung47 TaxID=658445 RepID=A0A0C5X2D2_9GAMM|nr:polysaccharide biosynthesis tyrosine autokinase [Photobacterium gaetbulicola]AJR09505.1 putative tyrosine-protein kinase Wzc [Photobacterium gaetbulicola Gung47]PSU14299.1 tyrosine-protein kinase [Photobacterium gaetbulicola]